MRADTPLKAIACFDAVMRTGSSTLAADQLFVTPGAVGQQLRKLEDWLGVSLFVRNVRKLEPTERAVRYWEQIRPALQQIDEANSILMLKPEMEVRFSLPPALASSWFARRLPAFTRKYPGIELHLNATVDPVTLGSEAFDIAVRHFDGNDPHLDVHLLLKDEVRVYCSPDYQERLNLFQADNLAGATLLYTTSHAYWSRWLALMGMSFDGMARGLRFDQSELAIVAASRGQGLALTSPWLVEDDVAKGRLIQLFPKGLTTGKNYYVVTSPKTALGEAAQLFYDWLVKIDLDT